MRIGIRAKMVILLTVVALLPLVAALLTITIGGRRLRIETFGQNILSVASSEAVVLGMMLTKDIEKLQVALQENAAVVAQLAECNHHLSPTKLEKLERDWPKLPASADPLRKVLNNDIASLLRNLRGNDRRFKQLLVTDRFGHLVAATERTSGFCHVGEPWWQGAWHNGKGRIFVQQVDINHDSGGATLELSIAIRHGGGVVGVARALLDVSKWVGPARITVGDYPVDVALERSDGAAMPHQAPGLPEALPSRNGPIGTGGARGWTVTADHEIQAYATLVLPRRIAELDVKMPAWMLVLRMPESKALGPVYHLSAVVLAIGLALIAVIFLAGLFLVERTVIRRIRRLGGAARSVAGGDLSHRIASGWAGSRLLGTDEIDDLARDFNRMIARVQNSHQALNAANELKANFIRIAGHELRTPVSYILGMLRLMADCDDPQRLRRSLETMGGKARRLDEIIHAMFKLMPEQCYAEELNYSEFTVRELLEETYLDCLPFLEKRNQRLAVEPCEDIPPIQADRDKLRDVVENIVMNAIKFTPDGGMIRVKAVSQLGGHVTISVEDQGRGIPKSELPKMFEPFYSGGDVMKHSSGSSGYQKRGMGLGLAIVRHFVELHGGEVRVSSGPMGSTFTLSIPIEPPPRQSRPESPK